MAIFAADVQPWLGKQSLQREIQPLGTLSDTFKKSILPFLLPLPYPSHRKNAKQNILTETHMLNKSAQSSFKPGSEPSFRRWVLYLLEMRGWPITYSPSPTLDFNVDQWPTNVCGHASLAVILEHMLCICICKYL